MLLSNIPKLICVYCNIFINSVLGTAFLNEKAANKVQGVPYKNLKIGIAKEKWNNEKR